MANCVVSGVFTDASSLPVVGALLRFNIGSPTLDLSGNALVPREFTTTTAADGSWSLTIEQLVSGILTLDLNPASNSPVTKYKFSIVVPAASTATFSNCWADSGTFGGQSSNVPLTFQGISGKLSVTQLPALSDASVWIGNSGSQATPLPLSGDVSMDDTGAVTVNTVGGAAASTIGPALTAVASATALATPGTIAVRDVSGNLVGANLSAAGHASADLAAANNLSDVASKQTAMNTLAGTQGSGKYLRSDGTNTSLSTIQVADVPTLNQNTTGTAGGLSSTLAIASGGTGQTTQQAALNALSGSQSSGKYLRSDGTNTALTTIQAADVPTLNQNTSGTAASVTGTNVVTNTNLSQMAAGTLKGNNTGSTANALDLTATQATAMLNTFTTSLKGLVPASSGGTTNFLRADGNFAAPPATGFTVPTAQRFTSTGSTVGYLFTVASSSVTTGATYTNNGVTYTVLGTTTSSTFLAATGSGAPTSTGTLTKATGSGPATITFSAALALAAYTTPTSPAPLYLEVVIAGGGGGGGGGGAGAGNGGAGGISAFLSPTNNLVIAGGGGGGQGTSLPGSGGSAAIATGPVILDSFAGGGGQGSAFVTGGGVAGGAGGSNPLGGAGGSGSGGNAGSSGSSNSGAGGGGGGTGTTGGASGSGGGGGSGAYARIIQASPSGTFYYAVGSAGTNGTAGTGGFAGGSGTTGLVLVIEKYQ